MNSRDIVCVLACMYSLGCAVLYAQSTYGSITGTVIDASGGVIARAKVEATNQGTGVARTTSTDTAGNYVFVSLDPGLYSVSVSADGFASQKNQSISLLARAPETPFERADRKRAGR